MKHYFRNISPSHQLILLIILILSSWVTLTLLGTISAAAIWGTETITNPEVLLQNIAFLKFFQIIQSLGLFIIPPLLFDYLTSNSITKFIRRIPHVYLMICLSVLIVLVSQPLISFSGIFNNSLTLPEGLKSIEIWMRDKETGAAQATEIFLSSSHWSESLLNIFIIAVLPAIGEELLFRGSLQSVLTRIFKRKHIAIILTAALFSAIHIQFFGFLPRFILGVIFGYLMLYSKNIWLPITAHFTNNFLAYILYQNYKNNASEETNPLLVNENYPELWLIFLSITGLMVLAVIIKKFSRNDSINHD